MPSDPLPAALVRAELDRVLASDIFSRSNRLSSFLKFIVERALAGQGGALKELTIATELYGKGVNFTPSADPIVRVDARRLRDRLREYYATAPDSAVISTVPKGNYTPVFTADLLGILNPPQRTGITSCATIRLIRHSHLSKRFRSADRTDETARQDSRWLFRACPKVRGSFS